MTPDKYDPTDKACGEVELPDTTAYGYGLIIDALMERRRELPATFAEDVEELIEMLELEVPIEAQRAAEEYLEKHTGRETPPVDPDEVEG